MAEHKTDTRGDLVQAFSKFEEHCEQLENVHQELRRQLKEAHVELDRKNRELSQRISEIEVVRQRLSTVLESITNAVMLVDSKGVIDLANNAAKKFFGADIEGQHFSEMAPELTPLFEQHKGVYDKEFSLDRNGDKRVVIASAIPAAPEEGISESCVIAVKDITAYRQLQEKVARKERMAALGNVAANVAHEIRNPLGAVEGFALFLQRDLESNDPDKARLANKIVQGTRELNEVVTNLLQYTREPTYNFQKVDFFPLLQEVVSMLEPKAEQAGVDINLDDGSEAGECQLDPVQVKQVFSNIVANAIDACPNQDSGEVNIYTAVNNAKVEISVSDNGNGIPENMKSRIFEPFFTMKDDGIGLGLPMCKRIVEGHNGTVQVETPPEGGTRMRVALPRSVEDENSG